MKIFLAVTLTLYLVLVAVTTTAHAAACGEVEKEDTSEVNQFFKSVQCTLEKAKPWVEEIEKEAKKLEETAKKFSEGVMSKLNDLVGKWITIDNSTTSAPESDVTEVEVDIPAEVNEIDITEKCADGQVLDVKGNCQNVL